MYPRGQIDIGWGDLGHAVAAALAPGDVDALSREVAGAWHPDGVAFLTVRTGFDVLLRALALPAGSEVVCTAVNIPDMYELLAHHGLVPVPVDLDPATLAPSVDALEAAITPRTRAVLITHLIGTRVPMDGVHAVAARHGLPVWEDCAQAFDGRYMGHADTAVAMFSFGPIKTATALGGGLFRVADPALRDALWAGQAEHPVQARRAWLGVVLNYGVMKLLGTPALYAVFVRACALAGTSHDQLINGRVLGLKGADWWAALRRRPSAPLLRLLRRRIETYPASRVDRRAALGRSLQDLLPAEAPLLGRDAQHHVFWQFVLTPRDPEAVVAALRAAGFDATTGASRLGPAPTVEGRPAPDRIAAAMARAVYVPAYARIPDAARRQLGRAIADALAAHPPTS
jgi:dTDP-4-amino-4,6-dideoxygalactose transaminase